MYSASKNAVTKTVEVEGTPFAYREVGPTTGIPVVFLHHFTAVLDDWDPAVVDGLAAERRVILVDLRGVGGHHPRQHTRPWPATRSRFWRRSG